MASSFWTDLTDLPLIKSTYSILEESKNKNIVCRIGMSVAESSWRFASIPIAFASNAFQERFPEQVEKINTLASKQLQGFEDEFPFVNKTANEVFEEAELNTKKNVQLTVRRVVLSKPGRFAINTLNSIINKTAYARNLLLPPEGGLDQPIHDVGNAECMVSAPSTESSDFNPLDDGHSIIRKVVTSPFVIPLDLSLCTLHLFRDVVFGLIEKRRSKRHGKKNTNCDDRKSITPRRKSIKSNTFWGFINAVMPVLGINTLSKGYSVFSPRTHNSADYKNGQNTSTPLDKRKCSNISDDSGEESVYDIYDLDNYGDYNSAEDSDYEPSNLVESSLSTSCSESELTLEVEVDDRGLKSIKVRDEEQSYTTPTSKDDVRSHSNNFPTEGNREKPATETA